MSFCPFALFYFHFLYSRIPLRPFRISHVISLCVSRPSSLAYFSLRPSPLAALALSSRSSPSSPHRIAQYMFNLSHKLFIKYITRVQERLDICRAVLLASFGWNLLRFRLPRYVGGGGRQIKELIINKAPYVGFVYNTMFRYVV